MDFVNARKQFYFHSTWGYGHRATKTYLGMIGDLQKGVADLGGKYKSNISTCKYF